MRAAVLNDAHELEVAEVADPSPGAGELVLQVTACGICGSDLKLRPSMPAGPGDGPRVLRRGRRDRRRHRRRVAESVGTSPRCRSSAAATAWPASSGEPAHCEQADIVGVGGSPGGFAEYVRVDTRETVALPESLDPALGALVEPLAVGLHAVERAHLRSGDKVLVIGAGPVGLSVMTWAADVGVRELVVSAIRRRCVATAAEEFGATRTVDPTTEPLEARYDVVVECVGLPGMTDVCVGAAETARARRDRRRVHQARSVRADRGAGEGADDGLRRLLHAARVLLGGRRARGVARSTPRRSSPSGWGSRAPTTRSPSSSRPRTSARSWCCPSSGSDDASGQRQASATVAVAGTSTVSGASWSTTASSRSTSALAVLVAHRGDRAARLDGHAPQVG